MNADTVLVVSHRRSGTHWTIDAIRDNCASVGESYLNLDRLLPWHESPISISEFKSLVAAQRGAVLIKRSRCSVALLVTFSKSWAMCEDNTAVKAQVFAKLHNAARLASTTPVGFPHDQY